MTARKPIQERVNRTIEANDNERDFGLVLAMSARRRQASQAGRMRAIYRQSPAQFCMTFQQFQKPAKRNKVLADYGLEPIATPFDPVPAKRRKRRQSQTDSLRR